MSTEAERAIAIARRYAEDHAQAWHDEVVSVEQGQVSGRPCWFVRTVEAPGPGEPDWAFSYDGHVTYFVDVEVERCFGLRAGVADHLF